MGMTFACFQTIGTCLSLRLKLKIMLNGLSMCNRSDEPTLPDPGDLFLFSLSECFFFFFFFFFTSSGVLSMSVSFSSLFPSN